MYRYLRMTTEAVGGTFQTATPAGQFFHPMDENGKFSPMVQRPRWSLKDGSGLNVGRLTGSEVVGIGGKWTDRCYWETAQWTTGLCARVNAAQTAPWVTDQRPNDLASCSLDFAYSYDDDSYNTRLYTGNKVGHAQFSCKSDPSDPFLHFDYDLLGMGCIPNPITGGSYPNGAAVPPTAPTFPVAPLTFQECVFHDYHTSANANNSFFDSFSIVIANNVKSYMDNGRSPNRIHCRGRTVTLTAHPLLRVATDHRVLWEAVQALGSCYFLFTNPTKPGGHTTYDTLKFDFRSNSFLDSVTEEMLLDADAYTAISATAYLDGGTGDDFAITFTPGA